MENSVKESLKRGGAPESQFKLMLEYFKTYPGFIVSVAYLSLTLCGIFYSMSFYKEFNIDILKLVQIADLMIIGISEPAAILMFLGGLCMAWGIDKLMIISYPVQQRWLKKPKSLARIIVLSLTYIPKSRDSLLLGFVFIFIVYSHLFVTLYAEWRGEDIKQNDGNRIIVHTETSPEGKSFKLLGSTANYVMVFDAEYGSSIIPVEQISKMVPEIKATKEKQTSTDKQDKASD